MGFKVLEELIDAEIVTLVNKMNAFSFLQSRSSCSGWNGTDPNSLRSDGVNRKWVNDPYLTFLSLDDTEAFKFLVELMKATIFDHNAPNRLELLDDYKKVLDSVGLVDDGKQLVYVNLEWRDKKIVMNIYLDSKDRTPEFIEKVFKLIENFVDNYKA